MWNRPKRWKVVGIGLLWVPIVGLAILGLLGQWHSKPNQTGPVFVETGLSGVDERRTDEGHSGLAALDSTPSDALRADSPAPQFPEILIASPEAMHVVVEANEGLSDHNAGDPLTAGGEGMPEENFADAPQEDAAGQLPGSDAVLARYAQTITDWMNGLPTDSKEMIRFLQQMQDIGQFTDAEHILTSIQRLYPDQPATYQALGGAYKRRGDHDKAIPQYATLRELTPQDVAPVLQLTDAQIEAGYVGDALVELCAAMAGHPQEPDLQLQTMRALDHIDRDQTLRFVQDWASLEPDSGDAQQLLGAQYVSCGAYNEALSELDSLIHDKPELVNNHIYRAVILEGLGLNSEALAARELAVTLAPQNPEYRLDLAQRLFDEGQYDRAVEQIQAAIDLMPENSEREPAIEQLGLVQLLTQDGQYSTVPEHIRAALDATPRDSARAPAMEQSALAEVFGKETQPVKVAEKE